jgi:hypothetical protein
MSEPKTNNLIALYNQTQIVSSIRIRTAISNKSIGMPADSIYGKVVKDFSNCQPIAHAGLDNLASPPGFWSWSVTSGFFIQLSFKVLKRIFSIWS